MTKEFSIEWFGEQECYKPIIKKVLKAIPDNITLPEMTRVLEFVEKKLYTDRGYEKRQFIDWQLVKVNRLGGNEKCQK